MKEDKSEDIQFAARRPETTPASKGIGKTIALIIVVAVFALTGGILGGYMVGRVQPNLATVERNNSADGNRIVTQEEEDVAGVASKVGPSVVSIVTRGEARSAFGVSALQGAGTGVIVSKDGYILTNKHVVQGSQAVSVVTNDGATYRNVKVVGADPLNDIAFLKIDGVSNLKPAELGDSTSVRIGQKVIAIGNALGQYDNTVTSGIISGTGRSVTASADGTDNTQAETLTDLIQIDAAINSGNSGGPLVNITGQVIGVNTALASDANSIGFSIPISAVKGMLKGVIANGKVERAYVGVNYVPITPNMADQYKLSVKKGAYVVASQNTPAVIAGSPAAKAGLQEKDIITKVGQTEVGDKGSVSTLVAEYAPGETIELTIIRDNKPQTLHVTLASYKS